MITLVLNAAEGRVQLVLVEMPPEASSAQGVERAAGAAAPHILCVTELEAPSRGTELLPPALHSALQALNLAPRDVGRIACVHGPGSFTGIRLVLAFAAGFRRATGCLVGGINYLHALAASVPEWPHFHGMADAPRLPLRRRVLTHARRDLVHRQDFLPGPAGLVPASEPEMVALDQALELVPQPAQVRGSDTPTLLLGSGYERNKAVLAPQLEPMVAAGLYCPVPGVDQPTARALVALAGQARYAAADLDPLYLRPCDAVDNLPHIAGKRGEDGQDALKRLDALLERAPAPEE